MLVPDARFEVYSRHRDVSFQAQAWLLVLHVRVDHGIPMEVLEQMYLGVSPSSVMASIFVSICGETLSGPTCGPERNHRNYLL